MPRIIALAATLAALLSGVNASANGPSVQNSFQRVELGEFEGGAEFVRAQELLQSTLLYSFQVVELNEFVGGSDFQTSQERVQIALFTPRTRSILRPGKPQLVSFDGQREFLKTSRRLRIWRADVGYTLNVGPDGNVTSCEITEQFRRTYVNQKLCDVLAKHHRFEPAMDSGDSPVEGRYSARLNYMDMRADLEK